MTLFCDFADVSFPSLSEGVYRVHLKTNAAQTRAEIWLESKKTKLQWECTIEDFDKHIASRYALPAAVVLASLKNGLAAINAKKTMLLDTATKRTPPCTVDVSAAVDVMELGLTIELSPEWSAVYSFAMRPIKVEPMAVLEARMRDLEEMIARPRTAFCTLTTMLTWESGDENNISPCEWTAPKPQEVAALLHLDDDTKCIVVLQPGLYHIHCTFSADRTRSLKTYLSIDEATVKTTSFKTRIDTRYPFDADHTAYLDAGSHIQLRYVINEGNATGCNLEFVCALYNRDQLLACAVHPICFEAISSTSNTASTLSQRYCEFANVTFPSAADDGAYCVSVKTNKPQNNAIIWLESMTTKLQWKCAVEDFTKHMKTAFALPNAPNAVILEAIKNGLAAIDGAASNVADAAAKPSVAPASTINLCAMKSSLALRLEIKISPEWTTDYSFELAPIEVKRIDILEARIRDLEEVKAGPRVAFCTLRTTTQTGEDKYDLCKWAAPSPHEAAALVHIKDDDTSSIVVVQPGLYHIHCFFTTVTAVTGKITLYIDDADVGTAPYTRYEPNQDKSSWYYQVDLSHVAQLAAGACIALDVDSNDIAIPGSMTIRKLQQGGF